MPRDDSEPAAPTEELPLGRAHHRPARVGAAGVGDATDADADAAGREPPTATPGPTQAGGTPRRRAPSVPPGTQLGRYLVLDPIARGGMGAVYRAYDPKLDRKVAIKLVSIDASRTSYAQRHERLLREAQALAQLNHPHVLAIHDVGTFAGGLFLAMELVEGQTLRRWLDAGPRRLDEVLPVLLAAGEGLAAAHRVGLVHRDVKPSNIMIGDDGRVRVVDFGLARGAGAPSDTVTDGPAPPDADDADDDNVVVDAEHPSGASGRLVDVSLTRVGTVLGTPRYMPPEQREGQPVDARADQFAFCACAYEALCGAPAYDGTADELRDAIAAGRRADPGRDARLPPHLRAAILRGLAPRADDRFPSMDELLAALRDDPRRRRRRWLRGAAAVTTAGALAALALWPRAAHDPCAAGAGRVATVWHAGARASLAAAFARTGRAHAAETTARVERALDDFAARWRELHRATCRAGRVDRTLPAPTMTARLDCLDRRLAQVDRAVGLFGEADAGLVDRAVRVTGAVTELDDCVAAAADAVPAEELAAVDEVRRLIDDAAVLARAGRFQPARVAATAAVDRAATTGHVPTRAAALLSLAELLHSHGEVAEAEDLLERALDEAARARDATLLARGWVELAAVVGVGQARYDEALVLAGVARRAVTAAGDDPKLRAELDRDLGALELERGDLDAARAAFEAELTRVRAMAAAPPGAEATALNNLGAILIEQGQLDEAIQQLERAIERMTLELGPDHPSLAYPLANQGLALQDLGRFADSVAPLERAYALERAALGDDSPELAGTESALAAGLLAQRRLDEARRLAERSLATREAALGADHPDVAWSLVTLATIVHRQGEAPRALALLERALRIRRAALGADHADVGAALATLAEIECEADPPRGRRHHVEALAIYDRALGRDHVRTAEQVVVAAECEDDAGVRALRDRLGQAAAALDAAAADDALRARARAQLARATRAR